MRVAILPTRCEMFLAYSQLKSCFRRWRETRAGPDARESHRPLHVLQELLRGWQVLSSMSRGFRGRSEFAPSIGAGTESRGRTDRDQPHKNVRDPQIPCLHQEVSSRVAASRFPYR